MSANEPEETTEAEPAEVLDPEQYNQNRRLKQIHQARENVREALKDTTSGPAREKEHRTTHRELAEAVCFYGYELLPLMMEAEWESELPEPWPWDTVRDFISDLGRHPDQEYPPKSVCMIVFSQLNAFAKQVGLGADLEDGSDEWEV